MKVSVLLFGSLKEEIGIDALDLTLDASADREGLLKQLANELGTDSTNRLMDDDVSIAVNQTIQKGQFELHQGDEVAFLPPITGG